MAFEICPQCGFQEGISNRKITSGMNRYVNKTTGEVVVMQRDDKTFKNDSGVEYILEKSIPEGTKYPLPAALGSQPQLTYEQVQALNKPAQAPVQAQLAPTPVTTQTSVAAPVVPAAPKVA